MTRQRKQNLQQKLLPAGGGTIDFPILWDVIRELPERPSQVLTMLYDSEGNHTSTTYKASGQVFGVTGARIRQNRDKAIRMLARPDRMSRYLAKDE